MTFLTSKNFIDDIRHVAFDIETAGTCRKKKRTYLNEFGCFDIETTTLEKEDGTHFAFMYIWQFYIAGRLVIGRTWKEWQAVIGALENVLELNEYKRLVIYSHNLSYEFQFERNYFQINDVFATSKREVVRCLISNGIEARCSWRLTNMSLAKFLEAQPNVTHKKLSGEEFDYKKERYPDTPMTERELEYCANDVIGLHEGLVSLLETEGDTIATVPYTSTGYVRREFRKRMQSNKYNRENFVDSALTAKQYVLCKTATRGGNCHANPIYSNTVEPLRDITSYDMTSAYPAVMLQCKFPMSRFVAIKDKKNFKKWIAKGYACLLEIELFDVHINTVRTIPYISKSKCVLVEEPRVDNGRILDAKRLRLVLTDIDYGIIEETYHWNAKKTKVVNCYISYYAYLPKELREQVLLQFEQKCKLKHGDPYYYMKSKNRLNADFGMMLTDICRKECEYRPQEEGKNPFTEARPNIDDALEKYYSNRTSFLSYQWGTWVTAHCRRRLQNAIDLLGDDIVYCDTDSAKFIGDHDRIFNLLNCDIRAEASVADVRSTVDLNGERFELGLWDKDGTYAEFKTLGAKKYAYTETEGGDVHITVAGLGKKAGACWINNNGKMDAFRVGVTIPSGWSGRTVAEYNDLLEPYETVYNGHRIEVASNTALYETTYSFGITDDYAELLNEVELLQ